MMNRASESTVFPTIEEYKAAVKYYASNRKTDLIHNLGDEHAGVIFTNMFEQSHRELRILAGSLISDLSQTCEYIDALDGFLFRDHTKLYIILDSIIDDSSKQINTSKLNDFISSNLCLMLKKHSEKVNIVLSSERFYSRKTNRQVHFAIGDDSMYRMETDIECRKAECCFNNNKLARDLTLLFDDLHKKMFADHSNRVLLNN